MLRERGKLLYFNVALWTLGVVKLLLNHFFLFIWCIFSDKILWSNIKVKLPPGMRGNVFCRIYYFANKHVCTCALGLPANCSWLNFFCRLLICPLWGYSGSTVSTAVWIWLVDPLQSLNRQCEKQCGTWSQREVWNKSLRTFLRQEPAEEQSRFCTSTLSTLILLYP